LLHSYIRNFANVCQQVLQQVEQQKQEVKRMAAEEQLEVAKQNVERNIKKALFDKNMTQAELANLIGESRQNINRAIKGGTLPRDVEIRKRIYKVLGME
jgi:ribosome-binding protein aMBF1 (putative translation factor)